MKRFNKHCIIGSKALNDTFFANRHFLLKKDAAKRSQLIFMIKGTRPFPILLNFVVQTYEQEIFI